MNFELEASSSDSAAVPAVVLAEEPQLERKWFGFPLSTVEVLFITFFYHKVMTFCQNVEKLTYLSTLAGDYFLQWKDPVFVSAVFECSLL